MREIVSIQADLIDDLLETCELNGMHSEPAYRALKAAFKAAERNREFDFSGNIVRGPVLSRTPEMADALRVVLWIRDPARRRANVAFTEGPERQIAYAIEDVFIARVSK